MKRRWPLVLLAGLLLLLSIAVLVTLLSARSIEGAVPGRAPLLGLALSSGQYVVGSETGVFVSADGKTWSKPEMFSGTPALVSSLGDGGAVVMSGGKLSRAQESGDLSLPLPDRKSGNAMGASGGSLYVAMDSRKILVISEDCLVARAATVACDRTSLISSLRLKRGPEEILALDAAPGDRPTLFAGGLRAGVWRSSTPEQRWQRVLGTATRAVMVDERDSEKIYIGTAGGLLLSTDGGLSWDFTGFRQPVEALAQSGNKLFVLAADRLIYESSDGETWKPTISP